MKYLPEKWELKFWLKKIKKKSDEKSIFGSFLGDVEKNLRHFTPEGKFFLGAHKSGGCGPPPPSYPSQKTLASVDIVEPFGIAMAFCPHALFLLYMKS